MPSDADRVFADGIPITLTDGTHHLRYGMRGLKVLEDSFDGLDNVTAFLRGESDRRFAPLVDALAAGLVHEGLSTDALMDLAEPQRYREYLAAVADAINLALPGAEDDGVGQPSPKAPLPSGSTGSTSTGSPRLASVEAKSSLSA